MNYDDDPLTGCDAFLALQILPNYITTRARLQIKYSRHRSPLVDFTPGPFFIRVDAIIIQIYQVTYQ